MKFPSLQSLSSGLGRVLRRFPMEMIFALTGTITAIVLIELGTLDFEKENICIRLLMMSNLGLVLSLSATLYSERKNYTRTQKLPLRVVAVILSAAIFYLLNPLIRETDYLRFVLLALAFHLLVSFIAFTGKNQVDIFWQFNKTLFLRFLTGGLYSAVLFLGLAAAIGSMNFLFNFKFEWDTFAILWVLIVGLFQTLFFLSGVPTLSTLDGGVYPNALKIFTQYVLIPLASVYMLILLAYEIKILIQWELPKGLVSNLVLGYAVFGILSILLVYPVKDKDENKWIKNYSRNFYYLLIPLIVLLAWAIIARVIDYGITEERYFIIILATWLTFIIAYFLSSKRQNISVIPLSLCFVTLLSTYGPQGAFETARRSQTAELRHLFKKNNALAGDKLSPLVTGKMQKDSERIVNIVDYLLNKHGLKSFKNLIDLDLDTVEDSLLKNIKNDKLKYQTNRWDILSRQKVWVYNYLNIEGKSKYGPSMNSKINVVVADPVNLIPLTSADYLAELNMYPDNTTKVVIQGFLLSVSQKGNKVKIKYKNEVKYLIIDSLLQNLETELKQNKVTEQLIVPRSKLSQEIEFKDLTIKILWNSLSVSDRKELESGNGYMLIRLK